MNEQYLSGGVITGSSLTINGGGSYVPHISTRAVRLKAGWVGQVLLDNEIIWESTPTVDQMGRGRPDDARPRTEAEAYTVAKNRVRTKLTKLLG